MNKREAIQELAAESECLVDAHQLELALDEMAVAMHADLADSNVIILAIMTGALVPLGHLLTRLKFPVRLDYLHATRYQGEFKGGEIDWRVLPRFPLRGEHVVIFDDILDEGLTLKAAVDLAKAQGAASVKTAVLLDKGHSPYFTTGEDYRLDYRALHIPNRFVYGFGLDYMEYCRNAFGIFAKKEA